MGTAAGIGAIAAPVVGGIIGASEGQKNRSAADAARQQALAQFAGIEIPEIENQIREYQLSELLGEFQPTMEDLVDLGPSAMEDVAIDPRLGMAQMQALETLSELGETGLTSGEQAALREIRRGVAGEEQARQNAILQEMARRGVAGSGMELAARLASSQSAADRQSAESDRLAQMAQQRALSAISQQAGLAGQIRGQEFGEQSDVARARDAITQWNAANQQALQQRNVAAQNQAKLRNLTERQRIAEQNVATRNLQQDVNKDLANQQFSQQMQLAAGRSGQLAGQAQAAEGAAARTADMWAGIGSGVGSGLASLISKKDEE